MRLPRAADTLLGVCRLSVASRSKIKFRVISMTSIFRKRSTLYKIIVLDELESLNNRNFKELDTSLCSDFHLFTSKEQVIEYACEYKHSNDLSAIFYASFEVDSDYYNSLDEKIGIDDCCLLSKKELDEVNLHIVNENASGDIFVYQVFEHKGFSIDIPLWVVLGLLKFEVSIGDEYFEYVQTYQRPYKRGGRNLYVADYYNRKYKRELGKIVVYKKDESVFYPDVLSAVQDNYDSKYRFGFENLHRSGIMPTQKISRTVSKFGVNITETSNPPENPYISAFNELIDDLYRWKYGKRAINCYNDPYFRDQDDGQTLDEFKSKEIRYRCFVALSEMAFLLKFDETKEERNKNVRLYFQEITNLLNRYIYNENSVFQKVNDLNDYEGITGIYILCFDYAGKVYIGQTKKCLKTRILQHFTKPQSNFDKNHSFEEVSDIYVLNIPDEYLDFVEMDCIASISKEALFNIFAGGDSTCVIRSKAYDPKQYLLEDKEILSILKEAPNLLM